MYKRILILISCIFIFFIPRIIWMMSEKYAIDILVVDKTVPTTEYKEHLGLYWILHQERISKDNGEFYDFAIDYHGYDPYEQKTTQPLSIENEKHFPLVYIADTYGVYNDEDTLVDGGITLSEWLSISKAKKEDGILIAEFNTFSSPTSSSVARAIAKDLNIEWTGWIGKYYPNLSNDDVSDWIKMQYEKQYGKKWSFQKGGLIFIHHNKEIVVLEESKQPMRVLFQPANDENSTLLAEVKKSEFYFWFDIVEPKNGSVVLANFQLQLTEDERAFLESHQIPPTFPAITHHSKNNTFYFSGDFAKLNQYSFSSMYFGDELMQYFSEREFKFFWRSYVPFMRAILNQLKYGGIENEKN